MLRGMVAGNLGGDAEVKITQAGDPVCSFSVACKLRVGQEDVTQWVRCSMWGSRGEKLAQYLTQGKPVAVTGAMSVRTYEKDGETRFSLELRVDEVTLMGGNRDEDREDRQAPRPGSGRPTRGGRDAPTRRREPDRRGDGPPPADDFGSGGGGYDDEIPF